MSGTGRNTAVNIMLLLGAVRWYNLALIVLSQYCIAWFVFLPQTEIQHLLQDLRLHLIVLSTSLSLGGAFVINGFYDMDKDLVNHPQRVVLFRLLGQNFMLNMYALITVVSLLLALAASLKVFVFVAFLVFMFWFYSHKLQKLPLIREIAGTLLAISPLIAIWLHYGKMHIGFAMYMSSLAIVGFTREVVKDLTGNKGNLIFGYQTVVVATSQGFAKRWLAWVNVLLASFYAIGLFTLIKKWDYFALISSFSIVAALVMSLSLLLTRSENSYRIADTLLKAVIVIHLLSLAVSDFIVF